VSVARAVERRDRLGERLRVQLDEVVAEESRVPGP